MKKKIIFLVIPLLFGINCNVNAASAYSVGVKYNSASGQPGDTTQAVYDAANGYYKANINSYYNIEPTYDYLNSQTRLGGSRAFFIAGHATYNSMILASKGQSGSDYWTGVWNGSGKAPDSFWTGYKLVGLKNRNMSNTKVITLVGCNTANRDHSDNLARTAVNSGAHAAVGWRYNLVINFGWLKVYNYALGSGSSVIEAIHKAHASYNGYIIDVYWDALGNRNSKITTTTADNIYEPSVKEQFSSEKLIAKSFIEKTDDYLVATSDISELYKTFQIDRLDVPKYDIIYKEDAEKYSDEFKNLFYEISLFDKDFNIKNYKLIYKLIDEKRGYGFVQLVYFLDENIQTNKSYTVYFDGYKTESAFISGVKMKNLKNINNVSMIGLQEKIDRFERNELNNIKQKETEVDYPNYFYDYNTQKLIYKYADDNSYLDNKLFIEKEIELN